VVEKIDLLRAPARNRGSRCRVQSAALNPVAFTSAAHRVESDAIVRPESLAATARQTTGRVRDAAVETAATLRDESPAPRGGQAHLPLDGVGVDADRRRRAVGSVVRFFK
jgi:hypothetical protein